VKSRSVIAYIVFVGLISILPVAFSLLSSVSDSFPNGTLRGRFDPVWIGFGVATLVVAAICMLTDAGERLLVRTTSHESRYYLTSAQPMSRKCQNPVTWYDRQVDGMVFSCSTFALFNYPADWNARRASIVHVLTGPYGIRVLSIHAIDSFFGQQDLEAVKDRR